MDYDTDRAQRRSMDVYDVEAPCEKKHHHTEARAKTSICVLTIALIMLGVGLTAGWSKSQHRRMVVSPVATTVDANQDQNQTRICPLRGDEGYISYVEGKWGPKWVKEGSEEQQQLAKLWRTEHPQDESLATAVTVTPDMEGEHNEDLDDHQTRKVHVATQQNEPKCNRPVSTAEDPEDKEKIYYGEDAAVSADWKEQCARLSFTASECSVDEEVAEEMNGAELSTTAASESRRRTTTDSLTDCESLPPQICTEEPQSSPKQDVFDFNFSKQGKICHVGLVANGTKIENDGTWSLDASRPWQFNIKPQEKDGYDCSKLYFSVYKRKLFTKNSSIKMPKAEFCKEVPTKLEPDSEYIIKIRDGADWRCFKRQHRTLFKLIVNTAQ